jgi:DNA-binding MarR family transcriptional regulator
MEFCLKIIVYWPHVCYHPSGFLSEASMETERVDDVDYEAWVLLHQARDAMQKARNRELKAVGLSPSQAAVLFIVKNVEGPATPAEISRWLFREPHSVSGIIHRMEEQGLVRRSNNLPRKNMVRVAITAKGEEAYQRSRETTVVHNILSALSPKQRSDLRVYLRVLRDKALGEVGRDHQVPFP